MKKLFGIQFASFMTLAMLTSAFSACSGSDDTITEINVPAGSQDYFSKTISFDSSASEKSFTFTTNKAWAISVADTRDGSTWCTVSPSEGGPGTNTVSIRVEDNPTYDERNAVVTLTANDSIRKIYVSQKQYDAILLSSSRAEVPVSGGRVEIEVKANVNYTFSISGDAKSWIHQVNVSTRGLRTKTLTFSVDKSNEYDKREGKIVFKSGNIEETVTVYQIGEGILSLSKNEFSIGREAQELAIEINSNFDYSVELPQVDWISEIKTKTRGISTHTLLLAIAENEDPEVRTAIVRVFDKNSNLSEGIIIRQEPKLILDIDNVESTSFDEYGGVFSVTVTSNINYKVTINSDWITELGTRSLETNTHSFKVAAMTGNEDRQGEIIFEDATSGLSVKIDVKQQRSIYFSQTELAILEGGTLQLNLTNNSGQSVSWLSSDNSVIQVNSSGYVFAVGMGTATITATTADGNHSCKCIVTVKDITGFISARSSGGAIMMINNLIQHGSSLGWTFRNGSTETVRLKSMQLVDGVTGYESNIMSVDIDVSANSSVSYSTTIGILGIHIPVTCRFRYEYKGKEYMTTAVFNR